MLEYTSFYINSPPTGLPWWVNSKESTCTAGDIGLISGLGRSLEKEMAIQSSTLAWKIPWSLVGYSPWGHKELDMT